MKRTRTQRPRGHSRRWWLRLANAFTRLVLHTPVLRRLADHQVCELRFTGVRSGREVVLPVMYAQRGEQIIILVGGPEEKRWWRNFARPHPVTVLLRGAVRAGTGRVIAADAAGRPEAAAIYGSRFPDLPVHGDPLVLIALGPAPGASTMGASRAED